MKANLYSRACFLFLLIIANAVAASVSAQSKTAYAITGSRKGDVNWTMIREVDLSNGALVRDVSDLLSATAMYADALTGKPIDAVRYNAVAARQAANGGTAFPRAAAAAAYDAASGRLYFTPLFQNELRYLDVKSGSTVFYVHPQPIKSFVSQPGEGDNITRMVFAANGKGYALTNNALHFITFSSGNNSSIKDLGSLQDGKDNGKISVHEQVTSWGGDMIADVFGNLWLFTASNHLFRINPRKQVADYIGKIKNLPQGYTINAAAVNENGDAVISSSSDSTAYYQVDLSTLQATALNNTNGVYNAADFANGNLAFGNPKNASPLVVMQSQQAVAIYPNPVKGRMLKLYFNVPVAGNYTVNLQDLGGRKLLTQVLNVVPGQVQTLQLPLQAAAGVYMLDVHTPASQKVFAGKLVLE